MPLTLDTMVSCITTKRSRSLHATPANLNSTGSNMPSDPSLENLVTGPQVSDTSINRIRHRKCDPLIGDMSDYSSVDKLPSTEIQELADSFPHSCMHVKTTPDHFLSPTQNQSKGPPMTLSTHSEKRPSLALVSSPRSSLKTSSPKLTPSGKYVKFDSDLEHIKRFNQWDTPVSLMGNRSRLCHEHTGQTGDNHVEKGGDLTSDLPNPQRHERIPESDMEWALQPLQGLRCSDISSTDCVNLETVELDEQKSQVIVHANIHQTEGHDTSPLIVLYSTNTLRTIRSLHADFAGDFYHSDVKKVFDRFSFAFNLDNLTDKKTQSLTISFDFRMPGRSSYVHGETHTIHLSQVPRSPKCQSYGQFAVRSRSSFTKRERRSLFFSKVFLSTYLPNTAQECNSSENSLWASAYMFPSQTVTSEAHISFGEGEMSTDFALYRSKPNDPCAASPNLVLDLQTSCSDSSSYTSFHNFHCNSDAGSPSEISSDQHPQFTAAGGGWHRSQTSQVM